MRAELVVQLQLCSANSSLYYLASNLTALLKIKTQYVLVLFSWTKFKNVAASGEEKKKKTRKDQIRKWHYLVVS